MDGIVSTQKNMENIKTTAVVFHSLWRMIPFNAISCKRLIGKNVTNYKTVIQHSTAELLMVSQASSKPRKLVPINESST